AVEPYERTEPSEGAVAAYNLLFDGLYTRMTEDIAHSRGRSVDEIKALIEDPPMSPEDALTRGLVDAVGYRDAVEAHLADVTAADYAEKLHEAPVPLDDEGETRKE